MTGITVVVVTFNSAGDIEGFLDSLDALGDADLRVIVSDNASTDSTVALARAHRREPELVETGGNLGYAAAINAALTFVDEDSLVIVANPDVRFETGFLPPVATAAAASGVGVVTTRLLDESGVILPSLRRDPKVRHALAEAVLGGHRAARLRLGELVTDVDAYQRAVDVDWASGALLAVTPECRRRVGSWDESFFLYSEETDFQLRARAAGLRVRFVPEAVAWHRGGAAHVNPLLWSIMTTNRVRLFRKHHARLHAALFALAVLLNEVLRMPRSGTHRRAARDLVRCLPSLLSR
jgi:N-acetylglucosaminyl-diphospho-decaprenol L-rhamnosyltransferase